MKRRAVLIDAEPADATGGGIRAYLRNLLPILQTNGWETALYTFNPEAYSDGDVRPISRKPWPSRPWRRFIYAQAHAEAMAFGHSLALAGDLAAGHGPHVRYEFCDYNGLAYHSLKEKSLKPFIGVRLHTPLYRIQEAEKLPRPRLSANLLKYRETYCLKHAPLVTVPSPEFRSQYFPELDHAITVFNPPPPMPSHRAGTYPESLAGRFLFLGRWEKRKGLLELLQAFAGFLEKAPEAELTLIGDAGDSPYRYEAEKIIREIRRKAEKPDCIRVEPAHRGEKAVLFARFDAILIPSRWENAPYVFYEALCHGVIALGSWTGDMGLAQKSTHDIQVEGGSAPSWKDGLTRLWEQRGKAREWRERQWKWLEERRRASSLQILDLWANRP